MGYPTQFRYSKEHEWIDLTGDRAKLGITEHAQSELGDVVFVELPAVGTEFRQGDTLGTVESVKAVSDIYAPVGGKVVDVNSDLEASPETINQDPHGKGWLIVLQLTNPSEADALLDAAAYEKLVNEE
jgi:glycine cleavage system H protein